MVKLTTLEKALLTYIGAERLAPGITKRSLIASVKGLGRISPPVARGALGVGRAALGGVGALARRQPAIAAGTTLYALNELGYLEPVKQELREFPETFREDLPRFEGPRVQEAFAPVTRARKRVNKFSKAVGKAMKAVKASKYQGVKGKLTNPKKTFSMVVKVASKVKAGKKVAVKGVTGTIKRAVRRFF